MNGTNGTGHVRFMMDRDLALVPFGDVLGRSTVAD
jgi:hypothetical protein